MPHFIYCGWDSLLEEEQTMKLKEIILAKMRKYGIESSTLTMLHMVRRNLVTKEKVKKAAEGKLKNDPDWKRYNGSINDDLERFFISLQNQREVKEEEVFSFFTPKLSTEELKFVQEGNAEHLKTYADYYIGKNPDVNAEEMKKSDSKSKYVHGQCWRYTMPLTLEPITNEDKILEKKDRKTHKEKTQHCCNII